MYWRATAWGTVEICLKGEESVKEALEVCSRVYVCVCCGVAVLLCQHAVKLVSSA